MPKRELSDAEIKADIMNKLMRRNCWGAKYLPLDTLVNWLAKKGEEKWEKGEENHQDPR